MSWLRRDRYFLQIIVNNSCAIYWRFRGLWMGTRCTQTRFLFLYGIALYLSRQGADSITRCHLTRIGNTIVEIRRSYNRLISTMGFAILLRHHLYIESEPRSQDSVVEEVSIHKLTFSLKPSVITLKYFPLSLWRNWLILKPFFIYAGKFGFIPSTEEYCGYGVNFVHLISPCVKVYFRINFTYMVRLRLRA